MPRKTISLRLDPELLERVDALASERGVRRTVVIEETLKREVDRDASNRRATERATADLRRAVRGRLE